MKKYVVCIHTTFESYITVDAKDEQEAKAVALREYEDTGELYSVDVVDVDEQPEEEEGA